MNNLKDLEFGVAELCRLEPRFQAIVKQHGVPSLRVSPQGLEGLLVIITEQFLSLKAAAAIWARLKVRLGACAAQDVLRCSQSELVSLGLSGSKARAFHAAASTDVDCSGLDEDHVSKQLCAIHGVGPWTADIYLLVVLGAANAWPKGDLALRIAVENFLKLGRRPEISEMDGLAAAWQPWRAVAAKLLWSHYRSLKGLPQAAP